MARAHIFGLQDGWATGIRSSVSTGDTKEKTKDLNNVSRFANVCIESQQ